MLGHGMPDWEWPSLRDIVVYPRSFDFEHRDGRLGDIAGMVHAQGPILFSRRDLKHGFKKPNDGHNVALHELAHVMERSVLMTDAEVLEARHLAVETRAAEDSGGTRLDEAERGLIRRVLEECGGNVSQAARRLGVSRELLRYRMRKHGLR